MRLVRFNDSTIDINASCLEQYSFIRIKPWVYGNVFSGIIYGTIVVLFFAYLQLLRRQYPKFDLLTRQMWMFLLFSTITFILCTLSIISALLKTMKLLDAGYTSVCLEENGVQVDPVPGIPGGAGITILENSCMLLISWMADSLLIWRCVIIYRDIGRLKWIVALLPFLLQVGSIVTGSIFCVSLKVQYQKNFQLMVYYESITLALNAILTALIISRLFVLRYRVRKSFGPNFGYEYITVATIFIESQAMTLLAQSCMVAMIMNIKHHGGIFAVYQILAQIQALAPMLLIYRVIQGKAFGGKTHGQEVTKPPSFTVP